ncbi:MAG: sugar kinase [Bacteroidetes bacterium]|nr:MAG: sugar kinase [Bacteroidota bacterium]
MIAIPTTSFIREADSYTIINEPVTSIDLMERAATALFNALVGKLQPLQQIVIFAGSGNNGGDGLVLARLFDQHKFPVKVFIVRFSEKGSPDFETNLLRLKEQTSIVAKQISSESDFPELPSDSIVIDALFGSGLNKGVTGLVADLINYINKLEAVIVSIDIPSGLFADQPTDIKRSAVITADYTYTIEWPKLAFFQPEYEFYVGNWEVVPIGLHPDMHKKAVAKNCLTLQYDARNILHVRHRFSHKGTYGHALLLAGSSDKTGAAILAATACLRSGAGLIHVHLPSEAVLPLQNHLPEAMVSIDESKDFISQLPDLTKFTAIAVGPGIGVNVSTASVVKLLIQNASVPLIIDADALNILSENKTWLAFLPSNSILTPHPKEFERLVGKWQNSFERIQMQVDFSIRHAVYVVLKGAYTCISCPDGSCFFNSTGNPGMATAGSGDVLTGILLGLMAQSYTPFETAVLGAFLHGLAGDLAAEQLSQESLIASDIVGNLGAAFKQIASKD